MYIALCTTNAVATDTGTGLSAGANYTDPYTSAAPVGVEASGGSYGRQAYNPSVSSDWEATQGGVSGTSTGTTGSTSNHTTITFATATGSGWGTITGIAICDNNLTTQTGGFNSVTMTFTHTSATVTTNTTTGLVAGDPIFLQHSTDYFSGYIGTITASTNFTLSSTQATYTASNWTGATTSAGTLTDGGNLLFFGALSSSKTVGNGDIFQFNANQLSIALS